jgi:hypothetical protein
MEIHCCSAASKTVAVCHISVLLDQPTESMDGESLATGSIPTLLSWLDENSKTGLQTHS